MDPTDVLDEIDCSWEKANDTLLEVCHCWLRKYRDRRKSHLLKEVLQYLPLKIYLPNKIKNNTSLCL